MAFGMVRRLRLPSLDRQVARGSMQICHKVVMQQLYISRADTRKQWVVVSNPSEEAIDMTAYLLADSNATKVFTFPPGYILLAGDEVTIWCSPGSIEETDNLLQPYLFWTRPDGSLRNAPFFVKGERHEVILLDPCMIEVASLCISDDGKKDFRVLHCASTHSPSATSSHDHTSDFCVGCLAPSPYPSHRKSTPTRDRSKLYEVYVFSRYWNVVSDRSLVAHFSAIVFSPLLEAMRALLIYTLFAIFQQPRHLLSLGGKGLRGKLLSIIIGIVVCDFTTRRLALWIKSGVLVSCMCAVSVVLDQLAMVAVYTSLERLYPELHESFRQLLVFELTLSCITLISTQVGFIEYRRHWHPLFKKIAVWDYKWQQFIFLCALGRDLLLYLLLLLPTPGTATTGLKVFCHCLVPLTMIATGLDFVRAASMLGHLLRYPSLLRRQQKGS